MLDGRAHRFHRTGNWLIFPEIRIQLVELSHFAVGSPPLIAAFSVLQVSAGNFVEPASCIEPCGNFVGEPLVMDKAICMRGANGLFIELLRVEQTAFDTGDLRAYQCGTVFEVLRAMLCPYFELPVVSAQSLDMLIPLVGRCEIPGCRARKRTVE